MLKSIYMLVGATFLGAVVILSITIAFPIFVALVVCVGLGFGVLEMLGAEDPMPTFAAAANKAVYHTGRIVALLISSPVWVPLWLLKFLLTSVVGAFRSARQRAAERAQVARETEQAAAARTEAARDTQRRRERDDILLSCEMFYNAHASKLDGRFTKADLDGFFSRYMGADESIDVLRRRSQELIRLIRRHAEAVDAPEKRSSLEGLTDWYSEQKDEIEALPLDESFKEDFLVQLNERFAELCQQSIERARV